MWSERTAYLLIALMTASVVSAQAVPGPAPPKPAPAKTKAERKNSSTSTSTSTAKKKPAPAPNPPPPQPPAAVHPEDEAIVRDLELYMLYEMLNDYELFYDDDETRKTTPDKR